jgi:hypothetical protein
LNIPVWIAVRILKLLFLNPLKPFAARSVKKKIWKKRCPSLPSREPIVSSEPAVLPIVAVARLITVPLATKQVTGD